MTQQDSVSKKKKILKPNDNGNATYQNFWDTAKVVLNRKFIAKVVYQKSRKTSNKISNYKS